MYTPTQAELDARAAARVAGRREAASAQAHPPTAEDQPTAEAGPLTVRVEILKLDPEDAPAAAPAPAPAEAAQPMKPLPGGLPTAVWLNRLALFHGASRAGGRNREPVLADGWTRTTWTSDNAEASADFPTVTASRLFVMDAADEGVAVQSTATGQTTADSGPLAAGDADTGPDAPETAEAAPRAGKEGSGHSRFSRVKVDGEELLAMCLAGMASHEYRRASFWRWWAVAGWLVALVFGAAAVALAFALRGWVA